VSEVRKTEGIKHDENKPDMTDIPKEAMWSMGAAFTFGQKKYGKNNYRNGMLISRQLAAAVRHIYQHLDGETNDKESKELHLGHAMASIAMAIYNLKNNPQFDDRFEKDLEKNKNENNS
jgi:CRISPR/Cas system CSM-associated protein Csm5 (group 7 of RAMP superfamily)